MQRVLVVALASLFLGVALGQQTSAKTPENFPPLSLGTCDSNGQCSSQQLSVVLDSNWRWLHDSSASTNCYTGNTWNSGLCPNPTACASNCYLETCDTTKYQNTYGISSDGSQLSMRLVSQDGGNKNVGSRVYLMDSDQTKYKMFKLLNREFTVDVDTSSLDCGLNGALYFVEMDADGGMAKYSGNKAGAKYGTGYCDAQCPHDIKFINGEANILDWTPSSTDTNSGSGRYGSCCAEMDIWESNKKATAYTPHPCTVTGQTRCQDGSSTACGDSNRYGGVCDKDGCDFNSYRMGNKTFFGPGLSVDSNSKMTVVTQFITSDNTDTGSLSEIRRLYVQNGKTLWNSAATFNTLNNTNSVSNTFCDAQKTLFGDPNDFKTKGGLAKMGEALGRGVVLTMSIWVDYAAQCLWLDSAYPPDGDTSKPGVLRGPCPTSSGKPSEVIANQPSATVKFSNIKFGPIGSTTKTSGSGSTGAGSGSTGAGSGSTGAGSGSTGAGSGSTGAGSGSTGAGSGSTGAGGSTTSCNLGSERCSCTAGGGCDPGLACLSNLCVKGSTPAPCSVGYEGCSCMGGTTCNAGLLCSSNTCVKDPAASSASVSFLSLFAAVAAIVAYLF